MNKVHPNDNVFVVIPRETNLDTRRNGGYSGYCMCISMILLIILGNFVPVLKNQPISSE